MTDISLNLTEDEFEGAREAQTILNELIGAAMEMLNNPDFHTKEEIVSVCKPLIEIIGESLNAGMHMIEGSAEIHAMTADPTAQQ